MQYCKLHHRRHEEHQNENVSSSRRFQNHHIMYPKTHKPDPVKDDKLIGCNKPLKKCANSWNLNSGTLCYFCRNSVHRKNGWDTTQSESRGLGETASTSESDNYIKTLHDVPKQSKKSSECCPIHSNHKKDCPVSIAQMKCRPVSSGSMLDFLKLIKDECKCEKHKRPEAIKTDIVKQLTEVNNESGADTKDSFCRMIVPFIRNIDSEFATVIVGPKDQMNAIDVHIQKHKHIEHKAAIDEKTNNKELDTTKSESQSNEQMQISPITCDCKSKGVGPCRCSSEFIQLVQNTTTDELKSSTKSSIKDTKTDSPGECNCTISVINNQKYAKHNLQDKQPMVKTGQKNTKGRSNRKPEKEERALNEKVYTTLEPINYTPWRKRFNRTHLSDISESKEKVKNIRGSIVKWDKFKNLTMQNVLNVDNKIEKKGQDDKTEKNSILSGMTENLRVHVCKILEHAINKVSKNMEKKNTLNNVIKSNIIEEGNNGIIEIIGDYNKSTHHVIDKTKPESKYNIAKNMLYTTKHSSQGDMQVQMCPIQTTEECKIQSNLMSYHKKNISTQRAANVEGYKEVLKNSNRTYYLAGSKGLKYQNQRQSRHFAQIKNPPNVTYNQKYKIRSLSADKANLTVKNVSTISNVSNNPCSSVETLFRLQPAVNRLDGIHKSASSRDISVGIQQILCNCSASDEKIGLLKPCQCNTETKKSILLESSSIDVIKKLCKCGFECPKLKLTAKSSNNRISKHHKPANVECGNKNVTSLYFPSGPIGFLKACFGPDDYQLQKNMISKNYKKSKPKHSSNSSGMEEDEIKTVTLTDTNDLNCPHISRKVLCDVKLKIKPGSNIETCSSYWSKKTQNSTTTSTSIKVNASNIATNLSAYDSKAKEKSKPNEDKTDIKSKVSENNYGNEKCRTCTDCCLKNHCMDKQPNISFKNPEAGQEAQNNKKPDSVLSVKFNCKCSNCFCEASSTKECNDNTCDEVKKLLQQIVTQNGQSEGIKKEEHLVIVTNMNEIKPAPLEHVKSKEVHYQSEAAQAICTCDAETQGNDIKYYISSISKELFCKSTSCERGYRRCRTVKSKFSMSSHEEFSDSLDAVRRELPRKPYSITAIRELDTDKELEKKSICEHCEALRSLMSRVEVVTIASFFVCIILYLCFNKMFNSFNYNKCRHTFC